MLDISKFVSSYDEIVVGCSLESLVYSYYNKLPFIYARQLIPHQFDFFSSTIPEHFRIPFEEKLLLSPNSTKPSTLQKQILFERLLFILPMFGLQLIPFNCSSIKIEEN